MNPCNTELLRLLQLLKEELPAPGAKFCALMFEAAGAMAALLPVVIPGPSE